MEFTLLWAALTAVAFIWLGTKLWGEGLPTRPVETLTGAATIGLLSGRLAAMASQGINPATNPGDIILVRGGVDSGFAAVGALATIAWTYRGELPRLDALAPAALMGLAGWHVGCLWRGACLGTSSDVPWAMARSFGEVARHPVEIYAAVALVGLAYLIARLPLRLFVRTGAAIAAAGLVRLTTAPLRLSIIGQPIGWYIAAIVAGIVLAAAGPAVGRRRGAEPT